MTDEDFKCLPDPIGEQHPPAWFSIALILLSALFIWGACEAIGETKPIKIKVRVVHGLAPISVTRKEAKALFNEARHIVLTELNIDLVPIKWKTIRQRKNYYLFMEEPLTIYERIRLDAQRGFYAVRYPTIYIAPPAVLDGKPVLYGATDGYPCKHRNWIHSGSGVIELKELGANSWLPALAVLLHEIGHVLGANEDYENKSSFLNDKIVNTIIDGFTDLHYSDFSKNEIYRCVG